MEEGVRVGVQMEDATEEDIGELNRELYDFLREHTPEVEVALPKAEPAEEGAKGIPLFLSGLIVKFVESGAIRAFVDAVGAFFRQRHRKLSLTVRTGDREISLTAEDMRIGDVRSLVTLLNEIAAPPSAMPQPA